MWWPAKALKVANVFSQMNAFSSDIQPNIVQTEVRCGGRKHKWKIYERGLSARWKLMRWPLPPARSDNPNKFSEWQTLRERFSLEFVNCSWIGSNGNNNKRVRTKVSRSDFREKRPSRDPSTKSHQNYSSFAKLQRFFSSAPSWWSRE